MHRLSYAGEKSAPAGIKVSNDFVFYDTFWEAGWEDNNNTALHSSPHLLLRCWTAQHFLRETSLIDWNIVIEKYTGLFLNYLSWFFDPISVASIDFIVETSGWKDVQAAQVPVLCKVTYPIEVCKMWIHRLRGMLEFASKLKSFRPSLARLLCTSNFPIQCHR